MVRLLLSNVSVVPDIVEEALAGGSTTLILVFRGGRWLIDEVDVQLVRSFELGEES